MENNSLQANVFTVDLCLKLSSFANISALPSRLFFSVSFEATRRNSPEEDLDKPDGNLRTASPYQILSKSGQHHSYIDHSSYISPLMAMSPYTTIILQEIVVFKLYIPFREIGVCSMLCHVCLNSMKEDKIV